MDIIRGNAYEANASSSMRGWAVEYMHEGLAGSTKLEIKVWRYDEPFDYGRKSFGGTEFIVIYGGKLRFELETEEGGQTSLTLDSKGNEYIILPPGHTKKVIVEEAPAFGVTVRWPSGPGVNKVMGK